MLTNWSSVRESVDIALVQRKIVITSDLLTKIIYSSYSKSMLNIDLKSYRLVLITNGSYSHTIEAG